MKERIIALVRTVWKEIIHKDDATDEGKKALIEEIKNSPPISPTHAFLHPFLVVRAHKKIKQYQGKTWVEPRLAWLFMLVVVGFLMNEYRSALSADATTSQEITHVLLGFYVVLPVSILIPHVVTTVFIRLNETCVSCHIIHRGSDEGIDAVLSLPAYRLPFLDPSRVSPAPWQNTWWKSTNTDVTLETKKGIGQLSLADIYDETVCGVRPPAPIPPTAKRYVVGKVERHGDVAIREKGRLVPRIDSQTQAIVIAAAGVVATIVVPILISLWLSSPD